MSDVAHECTNPDQAADTGCAVSDNGDGKWSFGEEVTISEDPMTSTQLHAVFRSRFSTVRGASHPRVDRYERGLILVSLISLNFVATLSGRHDLHCEFLTYYHGTG